MKTIGKLSSFFLLAFCWWCILMMSFIIAKTPPTPPPPYSYVQRLNLTAELILSSWNKAIVYAHANFNFFLIIIVIIMHSCFLAVCLQSPPSSLFNEFAQAYYILQVEMEKQSIFLYFNSS